MNRKAPKTPSNLLITGPPGIGKTTLINALADALKTRHPIGFYTTEIREQGVRKGFELVGLDGQRGLLAHIDIDSPHRVGKYRVDVTAFDEFLDSLELNRPDGRLIIIDEIGKMECLSPRFKERLLELLDSEKRVIATIALKGGGFIEQITNRDDVTLFEITRRNRADLVAEILDRLKH